MALHSTITFDTLNYAKRLQKAGFTEVQAEVQVEIIKEQVETFSELIDNNIATKADIKLLEAEIKRVEERINERITMMGYKTVIGLGSMIAAGVAILGVLIKIH